MIKLALLFMVVTIAAGVNHTISAYNEMMGRPEASQAFVVERSDAGRVKIGFLGQRLAVPDPVEMAKARAPKWQFQVAAWRARASVWITRISAWRDRAEDFYSQAVIRIKQWRAGTPEQKNRL